MPSKSFLSLLTATLALILGVAIAVAPGTRPDVSIVTDSLSTASIDSVSVVPSDAFAPAADIDRSGRVDFVDVVAFLGLMDSQDWAGDVDGSLLLDRADVSRFVAMAVEPFRGTDLADVRSGPDPGERVFAFRAPIASTGSVRGVEETQATGGDWVRVSTTSAERRGPAVGTEAAVDAFLVASSPRGPPAA